MLFAFINVIILFSLDYNPGEGNLFKSFILGFTGALSSCVFLLFLAKGLSPEFTLTFSLIVALEAFLLATLLFTKSMKGIESRG